MMNSICFQHRRSGVERVKISIGDCSFLYLLLQAEEATPHAELRVSFTAAPHSGEATGAARGHTILSERGVI